MQKIKNIHWKDPEKNVSQTDRQADRHIGRQTGRQKDGLMNRTGFIGPFSKDGGLIMFLRNFRKKF